MIRLPANLGRLSLWQLGLLAFAAGGLNVLAFAPFNLHPLALLGPALLFLLWLTTDPARAFRIGWSYGAGLLGFGVFWMHISIDQFGNVGTPLAIVVTLLFILLMALYYGMVGWLACRVRGVGQTVRLLLLFPAVWVLTEWVRGWFLSGFPWLAQGYSQVDTPLSSYAPLLGVYGVSWVVVLCSALLLLLFLGDSRTRLKALGGICLLWLAGFGLQFHSWTEPDGEPLRVSLVQGNVAQSEKWKPEQLKPSLSRYVELTRQSWKSDLVVWPETAVPAFAHQVEEALLQPLEQEARQHGSSLLLGIPVWKQEGRRYYNAMLSLGSERDSYYKRHLVPFGEFMPLKSLLKPLIDWLRIPMSDFSSGMSTRPLINVAGLPAAISICYEDAFGEEVIQALPEALFLVNASNDAWFGDSLAPPQHLQIARMRSLESERFMLRSTNTGISAIIGPRGGIQGQSPSFQKHVLHGQITPLKGATPYVVVGNWGIVTLLGLLVGTVVLSARRVGVGGEAKESDLS